MESSSILNRKAKYDFFLLEKFEAGIALSGCEVKSVREGKVNLRDSFVRIIRGEAFLFNCHISPYSRIQGHIEIEAARSRKLLLHKKELERLAVESLRKGYAIVPVAMYFKRGLIKVEIALARGKKMADKRESIKQRMHEKESRAAIARHSRRKG
ncbi:MAG: SsrA-binding protein SmpB [Candidatus Omnitrophica bacterium]|nr:SsrA-binding protein SmpB [Candidatus Omnitrophota bacterium]